MQTLAQASKALAAFVLLNIANAKEATAFPAGTPIPLFLQKTSFQKKIPIFDIEAMDNLY